jgi:hypothetical protein
MKVVNSSQDTISVSCNVYFFRGENHMSDTIRTFNLLTRTQEFLTVEEPDFPQEYFEGKHKVSIQLPNRNITKKQRDLILSYVYRATTSALLVAVETDLSIGKMRTENKNQANARAMRAPNVEKTMRDAWLKALDDQNWEIADRMLARSIEDVELYGSSARQIDKKRKELADAKAKS